MRDEVILAQVWTPWKIELNKLMSLKKSRTLSEPLPSGRQARL